METLRKALIAQGITNKIYSLCVFVPDSVIAAATPLFLHKGYPMWTNNFVIGDLSVNGLKGDGSTKVMDSGVTANVSGMGAAVSGQRGYTVLVSETSSNSFANFIGFQEEGGSILCNMGVASDGELEWIPQLLSVPIIVETNDIGRAGWISGNVIVDAGVTNFDIYVASPLESHKKLIGKVGPGGSVSNTTSNNTISVFAQKMGSTNRAFNAQRMSMAMLHNGLTQTESSNIWWAVKTCRECLGGGTGDPIHNWANKVVVFGGATISTTTSNALRTFYGGLDTDGLLYSMSVVNPYVPDNLTAARTPVIWEAGAEIWTNNNFGASNLTVGGLTGDTTTKYFGSAIIPSTATSRGFGTTSAGVAAIVSTNNANNRYIIGGQAGGNAALSHFGLIANKGNAHYYCWRAGTVNADFVIATATAMTNAYFSGQRTAGNAIALYAANTATAHFALTNGTGAQAGSVITSALTPFVANASGVPTAGTYCDHTISFLALTTGLTQTQSSNLWRRAQTLRTDLGGGVP